MVFFRPLIVADVRHEALKMQELKMGLKMYGASSSGARIIRMWYFSIEEALIHRTIRAHHKSADGFQVFQ